MSQVNESGQNSSAARDRTGGSVETAVEGINEKAGRNMPQAVLTAVVLIAIIVACLLVRIDLFVLLIIVFMTLGLWELRVDLAVLGLHIPVVVLWVCSAGTLLATYYVPDHVLGAVSGVMVTLLATVIAASRPRRVGQRLAKAVAGKSRSGDATNTAATDSYTTHTQASAGVLSNVSVSAFIVLYITALASCIILPLTYNGHPVAHAIMLIFLPALSDTGGLFAGAWLGKHKLSPRISPHKSVEGLIGSIVFAMVGAFAVFAFTYPAQWAQRWWVPVLIGVMVGVVGTFGDLCASMLKRDMGIKDMGHLLKGHGGVIDRVDSILLCAPFLALLLWCVGM